MNEASKILLEIKMLDKNIVPMIENSKSVKSIIDSSSLEEQVVIKRKFRKAWKKIIKMHFHNLYDKCKITNDMNASQKMEALGLRRNLVRKALIKECKIRLQD